MEHVKLLFFLTILVSLVSVNVIITVFLSEMHKFGLPFYSKQKWLVLSIRL